MPYNGTILCTAHARTHTQTHARAHRHIRAHTCARPLPWLRLHFLINHDCNSFPPAQVMRISQAWKVFQSITGSVTKGAITMEQYVAHYSYGR